MNQYFACLGGCYPLVGAPFNVPSDGHIALKRNVLGDDVEQQLSNVNDMLSSVILQNKN